MIDKVTDNYLIEALAAEYLAAKAEEDKAVARRREAAKLLEEAMPAGPVEGTISGKYSGIKVSITRKITRTIDSDQLELSWDSLPKTVTDTFKWKAELNTKHFRALQELNAEELKVASKFITSKPAASTVTVELIGETK